jgi:hypothetical protein
VFEARTGVPRVKPRPVPVATRDVPRGAKVSVWRANFRKADTARTLGRVTARRPGIGRSAAITQASVGRISGTVGPRANLRRAGRHALFAVFRVPAIVPGVRRRAVVCAPVNVTEGAGVFTLANDILTGALPTRLAGGLTIGAPWGWGRTVRLARRCAIPVANWCALGASLGFASD